MSIRIVVAVVCLLVVGCKNYDLEKGFFKQPLATRVERLRQYPLPEQYKIFRYGNDMMEPPFMDLAKPIAERGGATVPFLLNQLDFNPDEITLRDTLLIFEEMAGSKSYDVKSDVTVMTTLTSRVSGMKDRMWQETCLRSLQAIKDSK